MSKLTHPQKRIWFNEILFPNTYMHNIAECIKFDRSVNLNLLEQALETNYINKKELATLSQWNANPSEWNAN